MKLTIILDEIENVECLLEYHGVEQLVTSSAGQL